MNPWLALAAVLLIAAAVGGAGFQGYRLGRDSEIAAQARADAAVKQASQDMQTVVVDAIKNIDIKRVTIRQELEREIRILPGGTDCDISDGVLSALNSSITGQELPATGLPAPATPARQDSR